MHSSVPFVGIYKKKYIKCTNGIMTKYYWYIMVYHYAVSNVNAESAGELYSDHAVPNATKIKLFCFLPRSR